MTAAPALFMSRADQLREVVRELLEEYVDDGDRPAGHRCVRPGCARKVACSHEEHERRALLDRVGELRFRSMGLVRDPRARSSAPQGARAGSPPPWAAGPAMLLDEVMRGAVDLLVEARDVLGYSLAEVPTLDPETLEQVFVPLGSCSVDVAGRYALSVLPDHYEWLAGAADVGVRECALVSRRRPDGSVRPGLIEGRLRGWRARCLEMTGHRLRDRPVGQVPNPEHGRLAGPWCGYACAHESCRRVSWARRHRWATLWCPSCGRDSLLQDAVTGAVYCSLCRLDAQRLEWSIEDLDALGLLGESVAHG